MDMEKGKKVFNYLVAALVGAMLLYHLFVSFCINLSVTPDFYTTDMYADVLIAVEMWKSKTLFPSNWVFSNQLYCFATPVLSALIYGITGNPFRSMGAAAFLMMLCTIFSFQWMVKAVAPSLAERLVGTVAFTTLPVLFSDAAKTMNGWQLLFTMCAFYACYATTAFLAFGCYLRKGRVFPGIIPLTCALSFAMGIQSLRQTAVMVLPLMGMELLAMGRRWSRGEKLLDRSSYMVAAFSVANLAGVVVGKLIPAKHHTLYGETALAPVWDYPRNLWEGLKNGASMFLRDTSGFNRPVYLVVLAIFLLIAVAFVIVNRRKRGIALLAILGLSVAAILCIDVVLSMSVRGIYYFMLYPLVACLAVFLFSNGGPAGKSLVLALLCAAFFVSADQELEPAMAMVRERKLDVNCQVYEDMEDNGYTTAYSFWNGCEQVAAASHGRIKAGFWNSTENPFVPNSYLCDPAVYDVPAEEVVYVFYSQEEARVGAEKARQLGTELVPFGYYPEEEMYVYTAPVNLLHQSKPEQWQ